MNTMTTNLPDPTDKNAVLFERMYAELRSIAGSMCFASSSPVTLQPTALVNEAYLKIFKSLESDDLDKTHLLSIAAIAMRQVCIDSARAMKTKKRGDGWNRVTISNLPRDIENELAFDLLLLDDLLTELGNYDQRQLRIVELRFFGGLTSDQIAKVLDITPKRVELDWRMARAWLALQLKESNEHES